MFTAEFSSDLLSGVAPAGGPTVDPAAVVDYLSELFPGVHADPGGRRGIWHPDIDRFQGLYYMHKHICSMDRGIMQQWPRWNVVEELREVSLDYALLHEDFPVLALKPDGSTDMHESDMAMILDRQLETVAAIGWAEVFWQVLHFRLFPGLSAGRLGARFNVPMDWYGQIGKSPLQATFEAGSGARRPT